MFGVNYSFLLRTTISLDERHLPPVESDDIYASGEPAGGEGRSPEPEAGSPGAAAAPSAVASSMSLTLSCSHLNSSRAEDCATLIKDHHALIHSGWIPPPTCDQ
jgi:hypothetical protein